MFLFSILEKKKICLNCLILSCSEKLKLACEYQGEQHYKIIAFYHYPPYEDRKNMSDKEIMDYAKQKFKQQQERDEFKRIKCLERGIFLVEISYLDMKVEHKDQNAFIELTHNKIKDWKPPNNIINLKFLENQIIYYPNNVINKNRKMNDVFKKALAEEKYVLQISEEIITKTVQKVNVICPNNHKWITNYQKFVNGKNRCAYCNGNGFIGDDDMKEKMSEYNAKFIDARKILSGKKYKRQFKFKCLLCSTVSSWIDMCNIPTAIKTNGKICRNIKCTNIQRAKLFKQFLQGEGYKLYCELNTLPTEYLNKKFSMNNPYKIYVNKSPNEMGFLKKN